LTLSLTCATLIAGRGHMKIKKFSERFNISESYIKSECISGRLIPYSCYCEGNWYLDEAGIKILKELAKHNPKIKRKVA
jgi:hypothetical protein